MPNKTDSILIIAAIITFLFAVANSHFETFFNHFISDSKVEQTELVKDPHISNSHKLPKQPHNQHSDIVYSPKEFTQRIDELPKIQCQRPEKLGFSNQYFTLKTNYRNESNEFTTELKKKLNATFKHIETSLSINFKQTISLTMFFQMSREDYENFALKYGRSPYGNQGMFLSPENISIVEVKNYKQGIKTSIHEAVHTLNYAYWGRSLRFFNEGMAEYYKEISINGEIPPFDFSWLQHLYLPEQISTILSMDTDWHGDRTIELYQLSKAFFYFLMSREEGRKVVWEILKREKEDLCSELSDDNILQMLRDNFPNHDQAFDYWFEDGVNAFLDSKA